MIVFFALSSLVCLALSAPSVDPTSKPKVVVDVDAGTDDAMALLMLLSKRSPVDVVGITCVSGNTGLINVTKNVLKTLKVANRLDIPVHTGSPQGLVYPEVTDSFWGEDGFGDFSQSHQVDLSLIQPEHSAVALANFVSKYPNRLTIVALGPLTNIALAGHLNEDFFKLVGKLIILGGSYQGSGNVKPGVEFNMYADPEAAAYVFSRAHVENPITIVPMETVERGGLSMNFRKKVLGTLESTAMDFLNKAEAKGMENMGQEWLYFDQMVAGIVLEPDVIERIDPASLIVETHGAKTRGAILVDKKAEIRPFHIVSLINKENMKKVFLKYLS